MSEPPGNMSSRSAYGATSFSCAIARAIQPLTPMDDFSPAVALTPRGNTSSFELVTAVAAAAVIGTLLISAVSAPMTSGRVEIRHWKANELSRAHDRLAGGCRNEARGRQNLLAIVQRGRERTCKGSRAGETGAGRGKGRATPPQDRDS